MITKLSRMQLALIMSVIIVIALIFSEINELVLMSWWQ